MAEGGAAAGAGAAGGAGEYMDDKIMAQMDAIKSEISSQHPLVGDVVATSTLESVYDDPIFLTKIKNLAVEYPHIRKTRPDGNCFFRAFGFAYLEYLCAHPAEAAKAVDTLKTTFELAMALGYPELTTSDFYEMCLEQFEYVAKGGNVAGLVERFSNRDIAEYVVVYLRIVTSCAIKGNPEEFLPFMDGTQTIEEFCASEVEPMYRESDHMHIKALTGALGVGVRVTYLDRSAGEKANEHLVPDHLPPVAHVLYRPGHYDILYPA